MLRLTLILAAVVSLVTAGPTVDNRVDDRVERSQTAVELLQNARDIMKRFDAEYTKEKNREILADWNLKTNSMDKNVPSENTNLFYRIKREARAFPWKDLEDEYVKRQFNKFNIIFPKIPEEETNVRTK